MADDITLNPGAAGDVLAADEIGGKKHQRVKVQHGSDGSAVDTDVANPLPIRGGMAYLASLTSASLAIGADLDSGWMDMEQVGKYQQEVLGDASGISIEQSSSSGAGGTGVVRVTTIVADSTFFLANFPCRQRYMRFRVINNTAAPILNVSLAIKASYGAADQQSVFPLSIDPLPFSQAALVQSVSKGEQPGGTFATTPADGIAVTTSTPLGISGVYVTPWIRTLGWKSIELFVAADELSLVDGIEVEFTEDVDVGTVRVTREFSFDDDNVADGFLVIRFAPVLDGFRIRYRNGLTPQGSFFLHVHMLTHAVQPLQQQLEHAVSGEAQAGLVRSVISGKTPANDYLNVGINDGGALVVTDFLTEVGHGHITDHVAFPQVGRTPILAAGTLSDVWRAGGIYSGHPANSGELMEVISTSANDTLLGTGMRTVRITGLKTEASTVIEFEDIDLNGVAGNSSASSWWRIFAAEGVAYGGAVANVGLVTIRHAVTTANIFATLEIGSGRSEMAVGTVPAVGKGYITTLYGIAARTDKAVSVTAALMVREPGQASFTAKRTWRFSAFAPLAPPLRFPIALVPGSDVKMQVKDGSHNDHQVTVSLGVFLETS